MKGEMVSASAPRSAELWARLRKIRWPGSNVQLSIGLTSLAIFLLVGFVLPLFAPIDPAVWNRVPRDLPPQAAHPLGTTSLGQSVFWLLAKSIGNSLIIGLGVSVVTTTVGVLVGSLAGLVGGGVDRLLGILIDALIAVPSLPILILFAALFKGAASVTVLIAILIAFNWPWPARQVRAMVLSLRERQFIDVARFSGQSASKIITREIVPHLLPWAAANLTNTVLVAISLETGLAVIGVSNLSNPTLGTMIYWALQYQAMFLGLWWWIVPPAVATILLFIALFLTSSGFSHSQQSSRHV
jgi:peptide/nickel transport system permease protein